MNGLNNLKKENFLIDFFGSINQFEVINPKGAFISLLGVKVLYKKTPTER